MEGNVEEAPETSVEEDIVSKEEHSIAEGSVMKKRLCTLEENVTQFLTTQNQIQENVTQIVNTQNQMREDMKKMLNTQNQVAENEATLFKKDDELPKVMFRTNATKRLTNNEVLGNWKKAVGNLNTSIEQPTNSEGGGLLQPRWKY